MLAAIPLRGWLIQNGSSKSFVRLLALVHSIVDLTFRIATCRFLLAIVSRSWDLVCINLSFASRDFVCPRMTSIRIALFGFVHRRGHHALRESSCVSLAHGPRWLFLLSRHRKAFLLLLIRTKRKPPIPWSTSTWILRHVLRNTLCEHVNGLCPAGWLNEQSITKHWFQSVRTCPYSWATGRNSLIWFLLNTRTLN